MDSGLLIQDKARLVPGDGRMSIPAYSGDEPYIFLSYAHKDHARVIQEINRLNNLGFHVWYDEGIVPGNEWTDEIAEALEKSSLFLVMMTPDAAQSDNVHNEINYAAEEKKPFLAVHLEETELHGGVRLQIGTKQAILKYKFSEEEYVLKLVKALEQLGLKRTGQNDFSESGTFKKDAAASAGPVNTGSMTDPSKKVSGNHKIRIAVASVGLLCVIIGFTFGLSGKSTNTGTTTSTGITATAGTSVSETPGTYAAETQLDQNSDSGQSGEVKEESSLAQIAATDEATNNDNATVGEGGSLPAWYPKDPRHFVFYYDDTAPRVVDEADIFTDEEEDVMESRLLEIRKELGRDIVIYTNLSDAGLGRDIMAEAFYDYNGYGCGEHHEGICLYICMEPGNKGWWTACTGPDTNKLYTKEAADNLDDALYPYLNSGVYGIGVQEWIEGMYKLYSESLSKTGGS